MKKIDLKQLGNKVNQIISDTSVKVDEVAKETVEKSKEAGKKVAVSVQKGAIDLSDKMKSANYQSRIKKYNPLFPEVYFSESFHVPNMIKIVDDAERRGIDVCDGAIGWLGKVANTEILYLYDEAVEESGLTFVPMPQCNSVYYVDSFNRTRFIRADIICSIAHKEQVAELRHIAQMLGAKKCTIEIKETKEESSKVTRSVSTEENKQLVASIGEGYEINNESSSNSYQEGKIVSVFEGSDEPKVPTLKWFAYDDSIKGLIKTRLSGENLSKRENFKFSGSSTSAISQQAAYAIDSAVGGVGIKGNASVAKQMKQEINKTMYFSIEF